jgi:hypothetical protein
MKLAAPAFSADEDGAGPQCLAATSDKAEAIVKECVSAERRG